MAEADAAALDQDPEDKGPKGPLENLASMPVARQVGVFVALAASIAIGFWVVLWSQEPDYAILFNQVDQQEINEVIATLDTAQIPHKVNVSSRGRGTQSRPSAVGSQRVATYRSNRF
jgi:flagellar M-ring protein FliF